MTFVPLKIVRAHHLTSFLQRNQNCQRKSSLVDVLYFQALHAGYTVDQIHDLTAIDRWFLHKLHRIVDIERDLKTQKL